MLIKDKLENRIIGLIFLLSLVAFFSLGVFHLSEFITTDEHYWTQERIPDYWEAMLSGNWKKTLINDKPGISLAFVSGVGLFFEPHPEFYTKSEKHLSVYNPEDTLRINLFFRSPLLIFSGFFSVFFFWIARKITKNTYLALWFSMFILLSPVLLGISRIINPDSLLWIFSTASILSFIALLELEEKKFLFLTAIFLGLALLSKYIASILFPFLFGALLIHFLDNLRVWAAKEESWKKIGKASLKYWGIVLGSFVIFLLLFPAVVFGKKYFEEKTVLTIISQLKIIFPLIVAANLLIVAGSYFFQKSFLIKISEVLRKIWEISAKLVYGVLLVVFLVVLINWILGGDFLGLSSVPFDARKEPVFSEGLNLYQKIILEFYPIVFSLSPIVILLLIFLWTRAIRKKVRFEKIVFCLSSFLLVYAGAAILNNLLVTIRYGIMLYPLVFFLAALSIEELIALFPILKTKKIILSLIILFFGALSLWQVKPFYFEYTNSLLPKKYLITGSWGEGGYEAAQFLNALPNAKNLTIWADYSGTCEFFVGKCLKAYKVGELKDTIDYYVLTRRGGIRYQPDHIRWIKNPDNVDAYQYYKKNNPVWSLEINGRSDDFIKIFKAEED